MGHCGLAFLRARILGCIREAQDPVLVFGRRHLGASIGFLAVLHTWGQNLHPHHHLHRVVPGGGISLDGSRWIACRSSFFLPVGVLSRLFCKRFLRYLRKAFREAERCAYVPDLCERAAGIEWVVHVKPPFGGPQGVLKYLARYTPRPL